MVLSSSHDYMICKATFWNLRLCLFYGSAHLGSLLSGLRESAPWGLLSEPRPTQSRFARTD